MGQTLWTLTPVIAAWAAVIVARSQDQARKREHQADWLRQSLDAYGKIASLRSTSYTLRKSLDREGEPSFRLISQVRRFKASKDPVALETVAMILDINDRIAEIMESNASRLGYPLPKSFATFLVHQRALKMYWTLDKDAGPEGLPPFPDEIDGDIQRAIAKIWKQLNGLGVRSLDPSPEPGGADYGH